MPSPTVSSIFGAALGGLFYGTRLFVGFLNSDLQDKSGELFSPENKINNHLKVALEKIEKWKRDNNINCQIILAYGDRNSKTVELKLSDIIAKEHDTIFQRTLGNSLSQFERLGYDLELEKIGLVDEVGSDTDYDYSKKLKEACSGKDSITLTFQEVSWDAKGREQQNHFFWLPKDEQEIRTKVFNYLKRDLETPFRKIKKWKDENNITCEINLVVDSKETIVVSQIAVDPRKYTGSPVFARDLDDKVPGRKLSKFEKFANDLTSAKIDVKDEVGDVVFFEYSKKIKDACQGNKSITLNFKDFTWEAELGKKRETQKHSFWVPGDSNDSREQIFNYLDRDIETPIKKINEWKQKHNISCPIEIRMQNNDYLSLDEISQNPNKYIGHKHFSKTETVEGGRRISLFQKLVEGLDKKVEITDKYGNKEIYDYVGKLRQVCEDKGEIKLVHYNKTWNYNKHDPKQQLAYWFPADVPNHEQLILEFLEWDRKSLLKKIEKWERDNQCEITLVLKAVVDKEEEKKWKGKGTIKEIIEKPYKFFMGYAIFEKKLFIGENDEFSDSQENGKRRISQAEKLIKDLEGPIEMRDWDMEVKNYFLFQEIKDLCKGNNGKVELSWRILKWTKKDNKVYSHYFWHRKDFNQHGTKMIGSAEIHEKLKIIKTDIPTMGTKNPFPEYLEGYFSSFGITSKDSSKHYYSPFDF